VFAALAATVFRPPSTHGPLARDFEAYYAAGATWNAGRDPWSRDVWLVERTIRGVDASHDELLPFVGPAASLPLWSLLARLPFEAAEGVWLTVLVVAVVTLVVAALAVAGVTLTGPTVFAALLFSAVTGPVISAVTLGQVALLAAAAVALAFLAFERRSPWAVAAAFGAAIQPNLALPLAVRLTDRRSAAYLIAALLAFLVLTLSLGGPAGLAEYVRRLAVHGAVERFIVIQFSVPAVAASFGLSARNAVLAGEGFALLGLGAALAGALALRSRPALAAAFAIALLPLTVPFFHEHDFAIELIPVIVLVAAGDARVRVLTGVAAVCVLIDWLGLAQRPAGVPQTICLALALACAFAALPGPGLQPRQSPRAPALATLAAAVGLLLLAVPLAMHFPAPVWPDTLGPFHATATMDASDVWGAEQQRAGLGAQVPAWGVLRAIPLAGCVLLAVAAAYAMTIRPARTANGTALSD
jgi:hypothetical protein